MDASSSHKQSWSILAALIIICIAYVGYMGIQNYSTTPKWIGLSLIGIIVFITQRKQGISWSWGLTIWSVFIIQYLLSTSASYNTFDAITHSMPLIIAPLLVLALFRNEDHSSELTQFSVLIALITSPLLLYGFYELAELFSASDYTKKSSYGIRFSFGHKNQLAHFFALLVPFYVLGIALTKAKWKRILFLCSIAAIYLFVTLLMNRTSLILLYGIFPLAVTVYLIQTRLSKVQKRIAYLTLSGIALLIAILLFTIPERIPFIGNWMNSESGSERLMIWQNSLELAKETPIFGQGSGNWKIEILRTSLERSGFENQIFFQRAHSEFIHILVENGIIGLLTFLAFFVYTIIRVIRSTMEFKIKIFSITGIVGFLILSSLSFPLERVELIFLLFIFILPTYSFNKSPKSALRYLPIGVAATCLIFSIYWIRQERTFFKFRGETDIDLANDLSTFTIDATSTPVRFYEGNYYFGRQNYRKAAASFKTAAEHNPYHVHILNNLATSQSLIGQIDESKETYERLFDLDSLFIEGLMNAASVYFNSGDTDKALDYLIKVPQSKEPENFQLFATTILRAKLEKAQLSNKSNPQLSQQINAFLSSEVTILNLFRRLRKGESFEHIFPKNSI